MIKRYIILPLVLLASLAKAQQKPNIVVILSDDHAYQTISAYGSRYASTPNIDRIAKEGAILNRAYVTNSLCGPSRAVILTGKYSHKNGFKQNVGGVAFDASQDNFARELQLAGYQTAWIGKYHLESQPEGFSYWEILPGQGRYYNPEFIEMNGEKVRRNGYVTNVVSDLAESWLDKRDKTKPFCLVIGHKATHRNWMPDTADLGRYDKVNFPLPANFYDDYAGRKAAQAQNMTIAQTMLVDKDLKMFPEGEKDRSLAPMNPAQRTRYKAYYDSIRADFESRHLTGKSLIEWKYQRYMRDYLSTAAALDRNVGRILDYLDQHQLSKNTLVIYMSDQGFFMGEHGWFDKRFMYEESFRTPMLVRYPGVIKPGTASNDFILNLDIAPTLLDAAHAAIPAGMQGRSFLPLLSGRQAQGRDAMYYHYYEAAVHLVSPHFGIRTQRYKLIRFYERVNSWELFDLEKDPKEMNNLYGKKGYEEITRNLKSQLKNLIVQYQDDEALNIFNTPVK
ncbi:sulfatase (plasmid) [Pedobacter sp. BS3]|uniref:sulfatase family protein n=1 Tax=Pedobacter sp. BS3 TaxID=2567937 RepID=UPI0011EFE09B|nr:sulfatase [Pedobacter sp. BS3]TZF86486.1 sulfatase [Pedobacter sp. BS3]